MESESTYRSAAGDAALAATQTPPAATKGSVAPAAAAPEPIIETDAKSDIDMLKSQAFDAAKSEVDSALSAIDKLLDTAAGDVPKLLTDAEAAAVPLFLAKVPSFLAAPVGSFVQGALAGAGVAGVADAAVAKGLAYAKAEVAALQHHLDQAL